VRTISLGILAVSCFFGCNPDTLPGENAGPDTGYGCDISSTDLEMDDLSSFGFSADELMAAVEGSHDGTLEWWDGRTTTLEIELASAESAQLVEKTPWGVHNAPDEYLLGCTTALEVTVDIAVRTADGVLDEAATVVMTATDPQWGQVQFEPGGIAEEGETSVLLDASEWTHVYRVLSTTIDVEGAQGTISEVGEYWDWGPSADVLTDTTEVTLAS